MDEDALLAQALWAAEQADLCDMGSDREADSDSDYERSSKRRKKQPPKKAAAKGRPRSTGAARQTASCVAPITAAGAAAEADAADSRQQAAPSAGNGAAAGTGAGDGDAAAAAAAAAAADEFTAGGRRKRKDCGQKRERGRSWSDGEEAAFLSGLEQHGRDWRTIAAAIGSRDARAVASHAQKHFIKLCMSGTPLPAKVAESGGGFTLSGKLLDPTSAAAQAYGFSLEAVQALEGDARATALAGLLPLDGLAPADAGASRDQQQLQGSGAVGAATAKRRRQPSVGVRSCGKQQAASSSSSPGAAQHLEAAQPGEGCGAGAPELSGAREVDAILAAAPPPVLAASELAAHAAAPPDGAQQLPQGAAADGCQEGLQPQDAAAEEAAAAAHPSTAAAGAGPAAAPGAAGSNGPAAGGPGANPPAGTPGAAVGTASGPGVPPALAATAGGEECDGATEYARSRPRRQLAGGRRLQLGATSESLALVPCASFLGPPGSGLPGSQPYSLEVDLAAMLVMEVAVHLSSCEVIGLLGGTWQPQARRLTVCTAYPCRRVAGSDAATSVELDPASEVEVRGAMKEAGQRAVGWYHSHPVFEARPSLKDMENQRNYQALTRDTGDGSTSSSSGGGGGGGDDDTQQRGSSSSLEPFVGFILSPFDPALSLPHTSVTAFVVQQRGAANQLMPYSLRYGLINASRLPGPDTTDALRRVLAASAGDVGRTNFVSLWRPFSLLRAGALLGPPLSKLDKLLAGLAWQCSHVADKQAVGQWLESLVADLQDLWGVTLRQPPEEQGRDEQQQQQVQEEKEEEQKEQEEGQQHANQHGDALVQQQAGTEQQQEQQQQQPDQHHAQQPAPQQQAFTEQQQPAVAPGEARAVEQDQAPCTAVEAPCSLAATPAADVAPQPALQGPST